MFANSLSLLRAALLVGLAPVMMGAQGLHSNFDERLLAGHNRERAELDLAPLGWDADLARSAAQWADYLARTGRFEHSPIDYSKPLQGENIWGGTPGAYYPEAMVGLWASEKQHFKPGVFPANSTTGEVADISHYTQMVWRDTRQVGCALARGEREEILVCRYSSHGNIRGRVPF